MDNSIITDNVKKYDVTLMLRAALGYARRLDWAVVPLHSIRSGLCSCGSPTCSSPGKHPRTANGVTDATKDTEAIRQYWKRWPDANIGIATGAVSGFWVLDVDGEEGSDSLNTLQERHGILPDTVEAITGGGGRHILFSYEEGIKNSVGMLASGLDTRSDGGFIVVAPSIHFSRRTYKWELSGHPLENSVRNAPGWLLSALRNQMGGQQLNSKPSVYWEAIVSGVSEGQRNQVAASLAGHLFRRFVHPVLVMSFMEFWNAERNNPPLSSEELRSVVNSIARKELKRLQGGQG